MRVLSIAAFILMFSCQPSQKDDKVDLKALKDEVFEIHDEVMPKMGDLRKARKSLLSMADSIQVSDSTRAAELKDLAEKIGAANESMMSWMRNFDPNFEGTYEQELQYLSSQKESISQVNKDMKESLEAGLAELGN